jgi:hypothetical protein
MIQKNLYISVVVAVAYCSISFRLLEALWLDVFDDDVQPKWVNNS